MYVCVQIREGKASAVEILSEERTTVMMDTISNPNTTLNLLY